MKKFLRDRWEIGKEGLVIAFAIISLAGLFLALMIFAGALLYINSPLAFLPIVSGLFKMYLLFCGIILFGTQYVVQLQDWK